MKKQTSNSNSISALTQQIVDVKEDNSRVACCRFSKNSIHPISMVLTENGTFMIYNCINNETLLHYNKNGLIKDFITTKKNLECDKSTSENGSKKGTRFSITQQINSCVWPNPANAFVGVSLLRDKINLVIWLRLRDLTTVRNNDNQTLSKEDIISSSSLIDLDNSQNCSPICCMDYNILNDANCLIAVGMDDGRVTVVSVDYETGQSTRLINLLRNNYDQICSMSFWPQQGQSKNFPLGILATVSRTGLVLVWDVENEYYFADYQIPAKRSETNRNEGNQRINWFAVNFVKAIDDCHQNSSPINLIVSNADSGLIVLELPSKLRASKIRLNDNRDKNKNFKQPTETPAIKHWALIFNIVHDPVSNLLLTSSLDGNHIFWSCSTTFSSQQSKKETQGNLDLKAEFLLPSMPNNARTHMIRHSPIKEDLMALALGHAGIRFFKISEDIEKTRFDMNQSCALVARKINKASLSPTCIAWHPNHEYRLAIGTIEGKVFRADLTPRKGSLIEADSCGHNIKQLAQKKTKRIEEENSDIFGVEFTPVSREDGEISDFSDEDETTETDDRFKSSGKQSADGIYSLCWGPNPICPQDSSTFAIYATGSISHRLMIYYNKKSTSEKLTNFLEEIDRESLLDFPEFINKASEVNWKSSMDLLALGTVDSKVIIYSYAASNDQDLENRFNLFKLLIVDTLNTGHKNIQCLMWHPTTDKSDKYYYYLAVSINDSQEGYVFNLRENLLAYDMDKLRIEDHSNDIKDYKNNIFKIEPTFCLKGHIKPVSDMVWNYHMPNQIATSSFDKTCLVWSLEDNYDLGVAKVISQFKARDSLFTAEWSLVDNDLLYTSGKDSIILAFRPSENPPKTTQTN